MQSVTDIQYRLCSNEALTVVDQGVNQMAVATNTGRCTCSLWAMDMGRHLLLGLDRYRYRVSADTYFGIGADTNSSFTCFNS